MAKYRLEGPKPARMYEVILPKKLGYFGKVQEVLEELFDEEAIRAVPFIRKSIARAAARRPFDEEGWIKTLGRASRGYSIYEMDGRYLSPQGPVDERVLIIRFIFHNPGDEADPKTDLLAASLEVVQAPGRAAVRRGARGRGGDLVPGVQSPPTGDLGEKRRRAPHEEDQP